MKKSRQWAAIALIAAISALLSSCSLFADDSSVLVRSDPPIAGYTGSLLYTINSSPNGDGETNQISFRGINGASPMPLLTTSFGRGADSTTEVAQASDADGKAINVLSMNKWSMNIGLTDYLDTKVATFEQRDALGNRVCGAKVRLDFKPNIAQVVMHDKYHRAWDTLMYYTVPCGDKSIPVGTKPGQGPVITKPNMVLDLAHAKLIAMVIDQQTTPRVTGKPIFFNRGHSVTIVGGRAANLVGGWWETPAGLLNASNMVIDMVTDLDHNQWLGFSNPSNGGLVYSAGDADVYLSLKRLFLDRQSDYLVNFRSSPSEPWKRVLVNPRYNIEWNDFSQNYHALKGKDMPSIDKMVDQNTGLPKDINDPSTDDSKALKEIETAGCQNCPNPTLEQIQFIDETSGSPSFGKPLYAMTIRGWLGSQSSLVMFGKVPGTVDSYLDEADQYGKKIGFDTCPKEYDSSGKLEDKDKQMSSTECAEYLREGPLWNMLTHDASKFGFDTVGQFRVRDNSSYASHCSGSGDTTTCNLVVTNRRLDAAYMFTDTGDKLQKSWTIMQLLGEVGMRTLGLSYASGVYDGSGLDFAMAQPQVYNSYYTNMNDPQNPYNPELLFALDARALQLPQTLGNAEQYLYGSNN